jgi:hypothetical protein
MNERRAHRSEDPSTATHLYLSHLAARLGCEALALATADGEVADGVALDYPAELLGTLATLAAQIGSHAPGEGDDGALRFYALDLAGGPLYLATVGGSPVPVNDCRAALGRIRAA